MLRRYYDEGFADVGTSTSYLYTRDHLGSVRELLNPAGQVISRFDYDPWGRRSWISGTVDSSFGYAGYFRHAESGLDLTLFRAYDPELGRWLSRDPILEGGGLNVYGYVGNSGVNGVDVWGLDWAQVQQMLKLAKELNPEMPIPDSVTFEDLPDSESDSYIYETWGRTRHRDYGIATVTLDNQFLTHLNCNSLKRLYYTIVHESHHVKFPPDPESQAQNAGMRSLIQHERRIMQEFSSCCSG